MKINNYSQTTGIGFGAKRHINGVRQAATNLRNIYAQYEGIVLPRKRGKILVLDRLLSKKSSKGFDSYITSLSLEQVQDLLTRADDKIKKTLSKKLLKLKNLPKYTNTPIQRLKLLPIVGDLPVLKGKDPKNSREIKRLNISVNKGIKALIKKIEKHVQKTLILLPQK